MATAMCIVRHQCSPHLHFRAIMPLQMTDMQIADNVAAFIPHTNEIDIAEDWNILDQYDLNNFFIPAYTVVITILFVIGMVLGWRADKKASRKISALEKHMYLVGGDVTVDVHEKALEHTIHTRKEKCRRFWKRWDCTKVSQFGSLHESRISFSHASAPPTASNPVIVEMLVSKMKGDATCVDSLHAKRSLVLRRVARASATI